MTTNEGASVKRRGGPVRGQRYSEREDSISNHRHEMFVFFYVGLWGFSLRDTHNATDAARRAGYKATSARKNAWRLLRYPDVQRRIAEAHARMQRGG